MTPTEAKRESFKRLDETCPALVTIMSDLGDTLSNSFRFDDSDETLLREELRSATDRIREEVSEPLRALSFELLEQR